MQRFLGGGTFVMVEGDRMQDIEKGYIQGVKLALGLGCQAWAWLSSLGLATVMAIIM